MKKLFIVLLCTILLTGCNYGGDSTTFEPELLYELPTTGLYKEDNSVRMVIMYEDQCAVERTYFFDNGTFSLLRIKVYPTEQFEREALAIISKDANFSKENGIYVADVSSGQDVASLIGLTYNEVYSTVSNYYKILSSHI